MTAFSLFKKIKVLRNVEECTFWRVFSDFVESFEIT